MDRLILLLLLAILLPPLPSSPLPPLDYITFIKASYGRNLSTFAAERGLPSFEANFSSFCAKYRKKYFSNEEMEYRKGNFLYSLDLVTNNNRDHELGRTPFRLALNRYADFGQNENFFISQKWINPAYIQAHSTSGKFYPDPVWKDDNSNSDSNSNSNSAPPPKLPTNFDWRTKGVVTPVADQLNCGSCWIYAGISVVESANAIVKNPLIELSKQEIMDCVRPPMYISDGCEGGTVDDVYSYVQQFGVVTEKVYPYTGKVGRCRSMSPYWSETIAHFEFLPINSSDETIMRALYSKGPLAAVINAGDRHFTLYSGGVLTTPGSRDLFSDYNHYITIVGWGNEGGYDYWLIKNSWGDDWGEAGYVRLARGMNSRGINTVVSWAQAQAGKYNQSIVDNDTVPGSAERLIVLGGGGGIWLLTAVILIRAVIF